MNKKEHRKRDKHFTHLVVSKIRDNLYSDMVIFRDKFHTGFSEIIREALSQYISRAKADHPELFKHGK